MRNTLMVLCAALLASTSACVHFNVGRSYSLSPESGDGLVVLSLTDETQQSNYYLSYRGFGGRDWGEVSLWTIQNPVDWAVPRGRLIVLKLRAGDYAFNQIYSLSFASDHFRILFHVKPGRVTYLGNIHVEQSRDGFSVRVNDRSSRDLELFWHRYPNIHRENMDVFIGRVEDG